LDTLTKRSLWRLFYSLIALGLLGACPKQESRAGEASGYSLPPDQGKIAEVAAGSRHYAEALWWGFNDADVTSAVRDAIHSRADTIHFSRLGYTWYIDSVVVPSNKTILLDSGVVIKTVKLGQMGEYACLFSLYDVHNVTILGRGASIIGRNDEWTSAPYTGGADGQHRQGIAMLGASNILIQGVAVSKMDDGFYVGASWSGGQTYSDQIRIIGCEADSSRREGLGIVSVRNTLVDSCVFKHTKGVGSQAGTSFGTNGDSDDFYKVTVSNSELYGNVYGMCLSLWAYTKSHTPQIEVYWDHNYYHDNAGGSCLCSGPSTPVPNLGFLSLSDNVTRGAFIVQNPPVYYEIDSVKAGTSVPGTRPGAGAPSSFVLAQNYPNPFNPSTTIQYGLPKASSVELTVYDMLGRAVATLVNETQSAGFHEVKFDAARLASGVYLYRLQAGSFVATKGCLLVR